MLSQGPFWVGLDDGSNPDPQQGGPFQLQVAADFLSVSGPGLASTEVKLGDVLAVVRINAETVEWRVNGETVGVAPTAPGEGVMKGRVDIDGHPGYGITGSQFIYHFDILDPPDQEHA